MTLPVRHFLVLGKSAPTYGPAPKAILPIDDNRASSGVVNLDDDKPALTLHVVVNAPQGASFAPCENCGGEGGFAEPHGEWGLCPCCEGTGEVPSSEHELINLTDLDRVFGAGPDACPEGADNPIGGRD